MGHSLAPSKLAQIATSRKPLHPLVPRSATGAVRAARARQITTAISRSVLNELLAFRPQSGLLPSGSLRNFGPQRMGALT